MAEVLRAYAHEGIGHVQLVIDPITRDQHRGIRTGPARASKRAESCVTGTFVPGDPHGIPC